MKINKFGLIISLVCFLCLSTISTGFDLYSHSVAYYFFEYPITQSYLLFDQIVIPRYLLLSYIYEITRRLGIPTGVVASALILYPIYTITSHLNRNTKNKQFVSASHVFIILSLLLLSFFYSGLSLVLLWIVALLTTKKKVFLIGILFHPVGIILGTVLVSFFRTYLIRYVIMILIFLTLSYHFTIQSYFTANQIDNIKFNISWDLKSNIELLIFSLESKSNEVSVMSIILVLTYLAKTRLRAVIYYINNFRFSKRIVISILFLLVAFANVYFINKERHNLLIDTFSLSLTEPVYITWYDWGKQDSNDSFSTLFRKRYE